MAALLFHVLKSLYAPVPANTGHDALMIAAFVAMGVGFTFFFVPGQRASLSAALAYVFQPVHYRNRTARVDMLHFFLSAGLWGPVTGGLLAGLLSMDLGAVLAACFGARPALLASGAALAMLQFAVIFVSRDFGTYLGHALMHKVPFLWSVHRSHHSAEALTFFTSVRSHPLESLHMQICTALAGGFGGGLLLYFTGTHLEDAPVAMLVAAGFFFGAFGLAQHSHLPISFGRLNYLLVAPVMHQLHHSAETRHRDRNLGAQLALFDWMFGTLYIPQANEEYRLGLNEEDRGAHNPHVRLRDFYLEPLRHCWDTLTGEERSAGSGRNGPVNHCERQTPRA